MRFQIPHRESSMSRRFALTAMGVAVIACSVVADVAQADEPDLPPESPARIAGVLPDPKGRDVGTEAIKLENVTDQDVDLDGWCVKVGFREYDLSGILQAGKRKNIVVDLNVPFLPNTGAVVELRDPDGTLVSRVQYTKAVEGKWIIFTSPKHGH
ncbi:MAG: lamin tail domain-containing protein [Planctomycetaceae bacterium]|nr:lamin tail domain-containing protein [Planctomycetaceae bacterium]